MLVATAVLPALAMQKRVAVLAAFALATRAKERLVLGAVNPRYRVLGAVVTKGGRVKLEQESFEFIEVARSCGHSNSKQHKAQQRKESVENPPQGSTLQWSHSHFVPMVPTAPMYTSTSTRRKGLITQELRRA